MKTTIQILCDKGLFDNFQNADKVMKDFLFFTRRRLNLEAKNDDIEWFVHKYTLKNKATSNMKIKQVLCSIGLNNVDNYLRDLPFSSDIGIVNLHHTKRTHWVACINEKYFDSYTCSLLNKLSKFIMKRNGHCLYSG